MTATFPDSYYKKVLDLLLSQSSGSETAQDPETALTGTLELLSHFLNLNKGRILLWDTQTSRLEIAYSYGLSPEQVNLGKYEICEGITGEVLDSGRAILVENVYTDRRYLGKVSAIVPENRRSKSFIAVPIKHEEIDLGVLAVECNSTNDGDMEANALILKLVSEELAKIISKYDLNDFAVYEAA